MIISKRRKPLELTFQQHIADFLVCVHGYGVLEQADITDAEFVHALANIGGQLNRRCYS